MFENIHFKEKRLIIILVFILLFFATYKKMFKHTLNTITTYNTLKNTKLDSTLLKNNIVLLKQELEDIDRIIANNENDELIQQNILNFISNQPDSLNISIVSLENQHIYKTKDIIIYSNFLEIEGGYNAILQTIYNFENNFSKSKINSINLYTKKNYATRKNKLYAKILFQNFKKS